MHPMTALPTPWFEVGPCLVVRKNRASPRTTGPGNRRSIVLERRGGAEYLIGTPSALYRLNPKFKFWVPSVGCEWS